MAEPGLDSPEAARFYTHGPSFEDLSKNMTPDMKHRYTQWRAMQRQRDLSRTGDQEVLRKRGEESRALRSMFFKPSEFEDVDFLESSETDTEAENPTPFGTQYGSDYAGPEAADRRKVAAQQFITRHRAAIARELPPPPPTGQGYNDLNSRQVGISERTFLQPESPLANAAKRRLEKARGQRR